MRAIIFFLLAFTVSCKSTKQVQGLNNSIDPYHFSSSKKTISKNGAVVSAHPLASKVGLDIMKQGGNAFDAAIATQLALAVVYPGAGNIGGGGFMIAHTFKDEDLALDYRETAPAGASRDMYLDGNGEVQAGKSLDGHLSSGVPGTIAGLFETLKYAKLPFNKLIQPAIELAAHGFVITQREASTLNNIQADLYKYNTESNAFMKSNGWKNGDTLVQKQLAATLIQIRDKGAEGFYKGITARRLVEEMKKGGGLITEQDLKDYKAKWRTPLSFKYKGYDIVGMPMPSSGGTLVLQMLKMVENRPLSSYGFLSPAAVQLMVEVERRAFADRAEFMGDADYFKVPVETLTSDAYLKERMKDYHEGLAGSSKLVKPGNIPAKESEETTHLSIIDKFGNAVSVTTTLNNSFGSKTVVGGAGFLLNDEMDDFSAKPGVPNLYGAVGGEANAISPGKRMLSSMTPTIVLKEGKPYLVVGTPGGTTIPTSVFQTLVDIIDFGTSTEDAVNKPKFHHQWLPDVIDVEKNFPTKTRMALEKMGYKVVERSSIGRTEVIRVLADGSFEAVADSRGDDDAEGY
ncbi:MAG: gamma-glutamyltransferase [Candidatus Dadabacteria bacterium]